MMRCRRLVLSLVLLLVCGTLAAGDRPVGKAQRSAVPIAVMTQNLYIGTDILALAEADSLCALLDAVSGALDEVEANDFEQRVAAIADQILSTAPQAVGVQEAVVLRYANAFGFEERREDYLQMLLDALGGQYYRVETRSSAELEVAANTQGECDPDNPLFSVDVRVTVVDQDAILCRLDVPCEATGAVNFETNTMVSTSAGDVVIERGWASATVQVKGQAFHLFTTHLEVASNAVLRSVQYLQSLELVAMLNALKPVGLPQIVLGDFNADEHAVWPACDGLPFCLSAYQVMAGAGFLDAWTRRGGWPDNGYTCCQDADLSNAESALSERIDHVWIRGPRGRRSGSVVRGVQAKVVGAGQADRSVPDNLWPSDHAGVFARMWIGRPR